MLFSLSAHTASPSLALALSKNQSRIHQRSPIASMLFTCSTINTTHTLTQSHLVPWRQLSRLRCWRCFFSLSPSPSTALLPVFPSLRLCISPPTWLVNKYIREHMHSRLGVSLSTINTNQILIRFAERIRSTKALVKQECKLSTHIHYVFHITNFSKTKY